MLAEADIPDDMKMSIKMENSNFDDRTWQRDFDNYLYNNGPPPGDHPDPNHMWNTQR